MSGDLRLESTPIANALNNPRHEGRAIKHAHFLRHADIRINEGIIIGDHIFIRRLGGDRVLEGIGGTIKQEAPERAVDEMKEGEDAEGTIGRGGRSRGRAG